MAKKRTLLADENPELAKEWHPTKNGDLTPMNISAGSNRKVWWLLPYDVPMDYPIEHLRGKHFDFEWEAYVFNRNNGSGCPYLSNPATAIWQGFNDLTTTHPDIAKQWHPIKNGNLTPLDVTAGSGQTVWWLLPYDIPMDYEIEHLRGKHFDFEWEDSINHRTNSYRGCPYLSNHAIWIGFNDLKTTHPELAKEWHPTMNGSLKPTDVSAGSHKKVWWLLPYDVPMDYPIERLRGKHFDFEWDTLVSSRTQGIGCPFLSGQAVWSGFNDLATVNPQLAKEWHPVKNKNLMPNMVTAKTDKKVWWKCENGHEWFARISDRTFGCNCPICSKESKTSFPEQAIYFYVKKIFPDAVNGDREMLDGKELDVYIPSLKVGIEYDGQVYHQDTKRDISKNLIAKQKGISLIRIRESQLPILEDDGSTAYIYIRGSSYRNLDVYITECLQKLFSMLNVPLTDIDINIKRDKPSILSSYLTAKEKSISKLFPELAKQWHPTKNGNLTPDKITVMSGKKVWWHLPYDVPDDYPIVHLRGQHFDFEWEAVVNSRTREDGNGCPFLSNSATWKGFNDIATVYPDILKVWHPTKNIGLKDDKGRDISHPSNFHSVNIRQKVWCLLPYDVPDDYPIEYLRGKHFDFEWKTTIKSLVDYGISCPYLRNRAVMKGFNDLATTHPSLLDEWDFEKNTETSPHELTYGSGLRVWWKCPVCGHSWKTKVSHRSEGQKCPVCVRRGISKTIKEGCFAI